MGTLRHLQHGLVFLCLLAAGAMGAQQGDPVLSFSSWAPETDYLARCDFNNNSQPFCDWTQTCGTSQGTWIRTKHATPTPGTGPEGDYPDGKGYFIYQEASNLVPFETNRLESPELVVSGELCIDFWYHMLGLESQNELRVIILEEEEGESRVWSRRGNQSSTWLYGFTSVHFWTETRLKVAFEAVRGLTEYGDTAVDNVAVRRGPCRSCTASGDPHYYTFDKQTHHFMGNCTYTLSRLCDQNTSLPYFNVEAANEHRGGNTRVSYVQSVTVDVHGVRITLEKGGMVKVNGEREVVPSTPTPGVQISSSGFYKVVSVDFGLRVKFDGDHQVEVVLPSPYENRVCGLCGNYNGDPQDDFLNPDGALEPDSTSLGNSWLVGNHTSCSSGSGSDPFCTEEEKQLAQSSAFCGLLTNAAGPFRDCHSTLDPTSHFTSCLYDQCELHLDPDSLCKSLQSYADACWSLGVRVGSWRNDTFCPVSCLTNSHYESCASPCPATCVDPAAPTTCSLPCVEACACDSGFLLNNGQCVPSQHCGCWHEGKHYPVGSAFWTDDTCSSKCTCPSRGGKMSCSPASCPKDTFCGIQNGVPGCYPETFGICRVHNDPHYNTFDKVTLHFMGKCTYTLAKVCANSTRLPFFNIEAKNENRGNPSVSYVQRVLVEVHGLQVEIVKTQPSHVLVNKLWTTLPVSRANGAVVVSRSGRYVTLETDFRLSVSYDTDHSVEIRLPTAYANLTCGMCGNFNSRRQDDYMMPDGQQAQSSNELGNSWRVAGAEYDEPDCDPPELVPPCTTQQEALYQTDSFCGLLTSSEGPFAACHGVINPETFFESCVFDLCALHGSQQVLCNALGTYSDACQRAGVSLPSWRNTTFCPIPCPANSDYSLCASACPATCSNLLVPKNCSKPCVEDCECREGFVLSGGDCVSVEDCGCLEEDQYYEKEETFWTHNCERRCRCVGNGTLNCSTETCPTDQICKVQNGILGCYLPDTAHCHIYGDPHYVTFDGRLYHFQGGCNYTAVETCTNASQGFSVTTRNEHRGSAAWTALNSVAVSFQNLHIALRKHREVYVNGTRVAIPVSLPHGIEVEERPPYVVVRSPFGLLVKFDGDQELFVQVDERHKRHLCGLCGTYSGSQLDDFQRPDGTLEHDPDAFGNSWSVTDDHWTCTPPGPAPPPCNSTQELAFQELCQVILSSKGPFAACHWSIPPQLYFESCVYDQCAMEGDAGQLCKSLGAYAAACHVAGVNLGDWWKDTVCAPSTFPPEPSTSTPEPGPPAPCDFSCSFDVDFCSWTQSDSDSLDWTRHRGPTSSPTTGPSFNHTMGGGYFIYLKGTDGNPGDVAHLVSPTCISHGPHCFRFWYHMYGEARTMALRVYVVSDGTAPILLWSQTGNQGDRWKQAEVSVPHRGRVQILLEGVLGEDFRSNIAVDDISMTSGCSGSCTASGDPHYYTFDKQTHHFMGNCTYTLSRLCDQNTSLPYFNVEAINEHRGGNTRVSYVQSVTVDVHGVRITLEKGGAVKVNGEREVVPSTPMPGVQISSSGFYKVVSADFGLRVKFDGDHQVEVTLPSPYEDHVCGLCGNYNGNPRDDFLNPDGALEPDSTSLGNSWLVGNHTSCSSGSGSDPFCTEEEKQLAQSSAFCGLLTNAAGPFRDCHGTLDPTSHFTSCLYDQCELHLDPDSLCKSLQSYADACRSLGVRVGSWRNNTFCPISCPTNSHYESCASPCPATCVDPAAPSTCSLPCVEACVCDSGFLLNNGQCVPSQHCGCWHEGKHYPVGSAFWTDDTCSSKCTCPSRGGKMSCSPASCPKDTFCGIQNGVPGCYPETFGICRVHNDPHYNTFDKVTLHFMGKCTYTLAKVCANSTRLPFFNIEAKNENRGNPSVSYIQRVLVEVYGLQVEIVKTQPSQVLVNKLWVTLPVSRANGAVVVSRSGRYVTLETDFRLSVSYDTDHSVEIRLPTAYANLTCGMCGNFNSRRQDDYMMPDGQQAQSSNELGNSWRVAGAEYDEPDCDPPEPEPPCTTQQEELYQTDSFCGLLTSSEGPFAPCHRVINPETFFESCVFDLCALHGSQQALCNALGTYSDACQRAGVSLPSWRNATFCPIPCPANSDYSLCASACPATCSKLLAPQNCSKPCVEDCECREGFVLSGGDCVSVADCGCLAEDQYYEKEETFWMHNCERRCRCVGNGTLNCSTETCPADQICKVQNGILGCYLPDMAHCHIYGDPHYVTFDGRLYHFQGGCNYTAVETCTNASQGFSVTTRNEHRGSAAWTALNSVAISFQNLHIALRKHREVYVNGRRVAIPGSLPHGIEVEERPPYVVVRSPFGLLVKFDGDQELFVQVDERHKRHLCGLCGTYSGSQLDDFQRPDGTLEHDPDAFGNSWSVTDDHWTCPPPGPAPPPCNSTQELAFQELCQVILSSKGPFAACHWSIPPQLYFESCVYDQCAMEGDAGQLCKSLGAYAAACQVAGVNLGDWWKDTVCGSCTVSGDPHYYTFDKQTHHFMGNCTYTLSWLCDQNTSLPYFNVEATNEHRGGNTRVSYVHSVTVDVHGVRIMLEKGGAVKVNGEREVVPSTPTPGVQISSSGFYKVVSTDFGLRVKFDGDHQVEVTLPSPYEDHVCGLCGNYNGNPRDDFLNPDGALEPDSTSLGNSWLVGNHTSCSSGSGSDPFCTEEEKQLAQSSTFCGLLTNATGPFRDCHGTLDPSSHFTSCLYDQCELHLDPDSLCKSLQSYADACRSLGVHVGSWRNNTFCPVSCPTNSHYESCASPCPATCVDPAAPSTCSLPCVEACACDSGFLLNNGQCVPSQHCGCWHEGKHYPVGSAFWTDDTCSSKCMCPSRGGKMSCSPASCPKDTFCGIQNGVPGCYPETFGICWVHNDPHYNTFDKVTLHFMGKCTYTLAKVCANSTRFPFFNIEAKNENRGNPSVSYVQRVLVEVHGLQVEIVKRQPSRVLVNKQWTNLPVSRANGTVVVSRSGRYVTLETDFRLSVSYDTDHSVEIRLPTAYANLTCGMCGNFNSRRQDDYMMPDGQQAQSSNELGNSWRVAGAEYDEPDCDPPELEPPCTTQQEELYQTDSFCGLLTSPQGPFAACHGVINPETFFESCVFDLCALHGSQQALCNALGTYSDACQRAGVSLPSWRNATFCPIPCPANSDYSLCASACPATCSKLLAPQNCSKPCVEDCECREGFVLSGGDCVSVADCGCLAEDQYYEKEETFWTHNCERRCRCVGNGTLNCSTETCPADQICKVQNGILGCYLPDTAHCHIYGDPHYVTFDGRLYHFQGGCNYTAVETCTNASQGFSVTTRNEHRGSAAWTALNSVAISFQNLHIALRKHREVYVNGTRVAIPVSLPHGFEVEERPPYVVVRSPFGLLVKFDGDQELFVQVDERHKRHLCGLCGTYSGSQLDDFQCPDGTLEHDPDAFGNSWSVTDDHWTCPPPGPAPPPCNSTQELAFQELCQVILSSKGPFAACHWSIPPQLYFESCVYDQCAMEGDAGQLCKSLGAYAAACQVAGVNLGDWWKDTVCGSCTASGDPHYYTFDKQTHHFMGNCTYTLSRLCDQNTSLPYFNVEATNEHRGGNTRVSYVQNVTVDVHGVRITLEKGGTVKVNGELEVVPSTPMPGVQISSSGFYKVVSVDFGLRVKFDGDHQVEVTLPSPYEDRVCGLCGNYNGNPRDDFLNPDGVLEPDSTSLGNSWLVGNHTSCSSGSGSDPFCTEEEKQLAQSSAFCGLLTDAAGPFRDCHDTLDPSSHFTSCLYDQCELHLDPDSLCKSLQSYADACGVHVGSWRNNTFCPVSCPTNSHYESCASPCPATCVDPTAPTTCSLPCVEACACDSGFLLNNGQCVPSQHCGCWHEGKHYPVGSAFWTDDTCSSKCTCPSRGGKMSCSPASCPKDTFCGIQNGVPGCYPETFGICRVHNDPHYYTFDKVTLHFMGKCTYTLAKVCANSTRLPFFNIEAKNENRGNPSVSYVQRVLVEVHGLQVEIVKRQPSQVLVNKLWATLPVSRANGSVVVSRSGRYVTLETDFRLSVSYDTDHSVEIRLPTAYANLTCGMCGNFNSHQQDDYMMPDGQQAQSSNELGNSWRVAGAEYDEPDCDPPGLVPPCTTQQEELYQTNSFCGLLTSPQGPFSACHGVINPESFFESCIFDLCALHGSQQALCNALGTYSDACQEAGVDLPRWRNSTFCPLDCPLNSHYEACSTACPATCLQPQAPQNCSKPCVEDCACNAGWVLSGGDCVPVTRCGCVYSGQYYNQGENFTTEDCTSRCVCHTNGSMVCSALACGPEEVCKVQGGWRGCYPADSATCHVYGDPHYSTFDGRLHHFQGACNYTLVKTCGETLAAFSITARNEHRGNPHWAALNSVALSLEGLHVSLQKGRAVYVNGVLAKVPVLNLPGAAIELVGSHLQLNASLGVRIRFDGDQDLLVTVSEKYRGKVCGLCGTYTGVTWDDFSTPTGAIVEDVNEFGNSWREPDDQWP
ncbi:UNVERIFIED_CONTAM: hypothetical protein K2H54_065656, partial [Gekko kuhli]